MGDLPIMEDGGVEMTDRRLDDDRQTWRRGWWRWSTRPPRDEDRKRGPPASEAKVNVNVNNIHVPVGHELIIEGQIAMLYPKVENSVFYNPVQIQNRDLAVLMLGMYAERRTKRIVTTQIKKEMHAQDHYLK